MTIIGIFINSTSVGKKYLNFIVGLGIPINFYGVLRYRQTKQSIAISGIVPSI